MNEIVKSEPSVLEIIDRIASDPNTDVAKLEKMLELQERIMAKNAEIAFNGAMSRLDFPIIKHTAKIEHSGKLISTYTRYEDIDKIIRPIYLKEGFSLSFDSRNNEDKSVTYIGTLSHKDGHSKTAQMILPADTSGAKNSIQAIGSTISYAKRYLVQMLFNLVTEGQDDDAQTAEVILVTDPQADQLQAVLDQCSQKTKDWFGENYGMVSDVPRREFTKLLAKLEKAKNSANS